ncbi:MAG TPA: hypothetical protein PK794_10450, partial [Armatimonadota bacterium]|nr:hypothetical protein [Armatimonadota bacterium]
MTDWRRIVFGCLLAGVAAVSAWAQAPAEEGVTIRADLAYKTGRGLSVYERTRCKLDLYLPTGQTDFPTIVWFHGGALMGG